MLHDGKKGSPLCEIMLDSYQDKAGAGKPRRVFTEAAICFYLMTSSASTHLFSILAIILFQWWAERRTWAKR